MSDYALSWDNVGERFYEIGVDHGVFYPLKDDGSYEDGEAWSGLSKVTNKAEGGDVNDIWADNMKYLSIRSAEKFGATIECYSFPNGFKACNGEADLTKGVTINGQTRKAFGFCYRSRIGNDIKFDDYGYKLHLIYNATASPVEKSYSTINDSTDVETMSYDIDTTAIPVKIDDTEYKPTSYLCIDSTQVDAEALAAFEQTLYGTPAAYTKVTPQPAAWVAQTDYYTKSGDVYTKVDTTTVTTPDANTDYYTLTTAEVTPKMPLPEDVYTAFATAG